MSTARLFPAKGNGLYQRDNRPVGEWEGVREFAARLGFPEPKHIGHGIYSCMAVIHPEMAYTILAEHHVENNRKIGFASVAEYSDEMRRDQWVATHQGIAFNDKFKLCDGQHRLTSSVDTIKPFLTMVTFNISQEAMAYLDTQRKRTAAEAGKITGVQISPRECALVRVIAYGPEQMKLGNNRVIQLAQILSEPAAFITSHFGSSIPRITTAAVFGAIGRAFYHVDRERLSEFCKVLRSGMPVNPSDDSAAILLRRLLSGTNLAGGSHQPEVYFKTENAISKFVIRESIGRLYAATEELYPLPDEIAKRIAK